MCQGGGCPGWQVGMAEMVGSDHQLLHLGAGRDGPLDLEDTLHQEGARPIAVTALAEPHQVEHRRVAERADHVRHHFRR